MTADGALNKKIDLDTPTDNDKRAIESAKEVAK